MFYAYIFLGAGILILSILFRLAAVFRLTIPLLYALVDAHYPDFMARLEAEGRSLPEYVREEFENYLRCGVLEHGLFVGMAEVAFVATPEGTVRRMVPQS